MQAIENFAWNVRTLKGQAELIRSSKDKCMDYTSQVCMFVKCILRFFKVRSSLVELYCHDWLYYVLFK